MQTFLPCMTFEGDERPGGFTECARVLDNKRLGKQRVECLQILNALAGKSKGWRNHPAVLMWSGHELCLEVYMSVMIREWVARGFTNTMPLPERDFNKINREHVRGSYLPSWMMDYSQLSRLAASHRSNLLRKDPVWYGQFGWREPDNLPYYWPVTKADIELKKVLEVCA